MEIVTLLMAISLVKVVDSSMYLTTRSFTIPKNPPDQVISLTDPRFTSFSDPFKGLTVIKDAKLGTCYIADLDQYWNPDLEDRLFLLRTNPCKRYTKTEELQTLNQKAGEIISFMCQDYAIVWLTMADIEPPMFDDSPGCQDPKVMEAVKSVSATNKPDTKTPRPYTEPVKIPEPIPVDHNIYAPDIPTTRSPVTDILNELNSQLGNDNNPPSNLHGSQNQNRTDGADNQSVDGQLLEPIPLPQLGDNSVLKDSSVPSPVNPYGDFMVPPMLSGTGYESEPYHIDEIPDTDFPTPPPLQDFLRMLQEMQDKPQGSGSNLLRSLLVKNQDEAEMLTPPPPNMDSPALPNFFRRN